jgi:hypothetical protein
MELAMIKSKTLTAALAALTLAATLTAFGGQAQAHSHWGHNGWAIGAGFAAGTLIGAAAASNSYYVAPSYRECRYVERVDRWGNLRTIRVCDVY